MSEAAVVPTAPLPPPGARASTRQLWEERLARFSCSGLRPAEFCASEGVSLPSFYSWRRRLDPDHRTTTAAATTDPTPGPRLLPVRLPAAAAVVEVVLPSGPVLRVSAGCDLGFLRCLVEALGDTPC